MKRKRGWRWKAPLTMGLLLLLAYFGARIWGLWIDMELVEAYRAIDAVAPPQARIVVLDSEARAARYYGKRDTVAPLNVAGRFASREVTIRDFLNQPLTAAKDPLYVVVTRKDLERIPEWSGLNVTPLFFSNPVVTLNPEGVDVKIEGDGAVLYQLRNATGTVGYALEQHGYNRTLGTYIQPGGIVKKDGAGCLLALEVFVVLADAACDLPAVRLLADHPPAGAVLVHKSPRIRVYRIG